MFILKSRVYKDGELVGYGLYDELTGEMQNVDKGYVWNLAYTKDIMNVKSVGTPEKPNGITGINGFEIKKLPVVQIGQKDNKVESDKKWKGAEAASGSIRYVVQNTKFDSPVENVDIKTVIAFLDRELASGKIKKADLGKYGKDFTVLRRVENKAHAGAIKDVTPDDVQKNIKQFRDVKGAIEEGLTRLVMAAKKCDNIIIKSGPLKNVEKLACNSVKELDDALKKCKIPVDLYKELNIDGSGQIVYKDFATRCERVTVKISDMMSEALRIYMKGKRKLVTVPSIVGYEIKYTGKDNITARRYNTNTSSLEAYTIKPGEKLYLSYADTALLASVPEVGTMIGGKALILRMSSSKSVLDFLKRCYIQGCQDEDGIKAIDISELPKEIVDRTFKVVKKTVR